jgi:hypothetical protein
MSIVEGFRPLAPVAVAPSRLCSGAGLARLRAEARLIRRYPREYRRVLPIEGHVGAIQHLVRSHRPKYDGYLLEALIEHDRLFRRPNGQASSSADTATSRIPARAG